ncbi:hypothetical protein VYU27_009123, partial [Nannochloropsis oceanica]
MRGLKAFQRRGADTEEEEEEKEEEKKEEKEEDALAAVATKKRGPGDDNQSNDHDEEKTANEDTGSPAGAGLEEGELCDDDKEAIQTTVSAAIAAAIEEWGDRQGEEEEEEGEGEKKKREDGNDGKESAPLVAAGGENEEEEDEDVEASLYPPAPPSGLLPPFWAAAQDPSTNATYYFHQQTGVRSWEPPPLLPLSPPHTYPGQVPVAPPSAPQLPPELAKLHAALDKVDSTLSNADTFSFPPAAATSSVPLSPSEAAAAVWVELVDEGTGRVYYYDNVSGATRWSMPQAFQGESRTAWPEGGLHGGLQPPVISAYDRDVRILSHFFDPSTLAANREEAKRKKAEMCTGVDWRQDVLHSSSTSLVSVLREGLGAIALNRRESGWVVLMSNATTTELPEEGKGREGGRKRDEGPCRGTGTLPTIVLKGLPFDEERSRQAYWRWLSPSVPLIGQGLAYSAFAAVLWPSVPFTVPEDRVGVAYGLTTAIQNGG